MQLRAHGGRIKMGATIFQMRECIESLGASQYKCSVSLVHHPHQQDNQGVSPKASVVWQEKIKE